ncbi:MAG TPA: DUF308 domain-containing protein [Acidimicrobiales bacterium]|nr:DUF308 domain-containing protein [Acidimicrobiales bacterium]
MTDFDAGFDAVPPPPRPIEYADRDSRGWWISVLGGIALIVLGVWLLTNLFESVTVLAWLIGISLIVAGIVEVLALHAVREVAAAAWISGGLLVAGGIAVLVWPDATLWALAVVAGLVLLLAGILRVVVALADRDSGDMPLQLGLGGLTAALGIVVLVWPGQTLVVLAVLLGLRAIGSGLVAIGVGLQMRRLA